MFDKYKQFITCFILENIGSFYAESVTVK